MNNKLKILSSILKSAGLELEAREVGSMATEKTKLYIFDFDGTLFRSPEKPDQFEGGWWGKDYSLSPPCVPQSPGNEWWVPEVVSEANSAINDPEAISVLMTGRLAKIFSNRMSELLGSAGLTFHEVMLSDSGDTQAFKMRQIKRLLSENPSINFVKIYDDRRDYLISYSSLISDINPEIEVQTSHIQVAPMPAECTEPPKKKLPLPKFTPFVGVFLDEDEKQKLLQRFPAIHPNVFAEHVTIKFKPSKEDMISIDQLGLFGEKFDINVTGYVEDELGQAVTVSVSDLPEGIFPEGRTQHITISTADGIKPVYSNELISNKETTKINDLTLSGIMRWK